MPFTRTYNWGESPHSSTSTSRPRRPYSESVPTCSSSPWGLTPPTGGWAVQAALGHRSLVATQIYLRGRVEPLRGPMAGRSYAAPVSP